MSNKFVVKCANYRQLALKCVSSRQPQIYRFNFDMLDLDLVVNIKSIPGLFRRNSRRHLKWACHMHFGANSTWGSNNVNLLIISKGAFSFFFFFFFLFYC